MLRFIHKIIQTFFQLYLFQYILCYASFLFPEEHRARNVMIIISIHIMLRFINMKKIDDFTVKLFQYILCYVSFLINTRFLSYETFTF